MNELVSIIMSVYNAENTLRDAIESILNQTYKNIEFVICDDVSTDNSYQILQEYARKDSRIVLIQNQTNSKLPFSLNHCLKYVKGKYVARMDADDLSTLDRIEKEVNFLQNHLEYDLVGSQMQRFNENGVIDIAGKPEYVDKYYLRNGIPFNHATIMTYKSVYDKLGGYTVSKRTVRGQDLDLWFRFYAAGFDGYNIQEPLYMVREDTAAIRRRTFSVRWNGIKTRYVGFRLLHFPLRWMIIPGIIELAKGLVPYKIYALYRKLQKRKYQKNN